MINKLLRKLVYSNDIFFKLFYNYIYNPKDELSKFLDEYSKRMKGKIYFLQIGANDGQWNDPIYKFIRRDGWGGVLIEPQKDVFDKLKYNYRNFRNLVFENVAIDKKEGEKKFYRIGFTNARWATGLSSFNKEDIERMIEAGYIERMAKNDGTTTPSDKGKWINEESIKTKTLKNIIDKNNITNVNLIMIDTEGYDYEIVKTIPFERIKPEVIVYEHSHLCKEDRKEAEEYLRQMGYNVKSAQSDTIAYKSI